MMKNEIKIGRSPLGPGAFSFPRFVRPSALNSDPYGAADLVSSGLAVHGPHVGQPNLVCECMHVLHVVPYPSKTEMAYSI